MVEIQDVLKGKTLNRPTRSKTPVGELLLRQSRLVAYLQRIL
jgi:hypothetical protein